MDWKSVDAEIERKSLLKHPFYRAWSAGELTVADLREYAKQYYHLEAYFPRLLSAIHSRIDDPDARRAVLENLVDEERGTENHRELWLRFAEALGAGREEVLAGRPSEKTAEAIAALRALAEDADPAVGLSALYGYESQQPAVSASKIDGLRRCYGIDGERALGFFTVHRELDAWHAESERRALERLGASAETARAAAGKACGALWTFLDGVDASTRLARGGACACA